MPIALGAHSPKLDPVRALRSKEGRKEQQRYAIEGPTLLREALAGGRRPEAVYATEEAWAGFLRAEPEPDIPVYIVPERALAKLSELETPPGILAVLPLGLEPVSGLFADPGPAVLLAGIADPGNAGTLLRSAEIFGISKAIFGRGSVEPHNPKVVRATMGALFRMRVAVAAPEELLEAARAGHFTVVAASREGLPLDGFHFPERVVVAVGNERSGVRGWLPRWDLGVAIPQPGGGESLNAAVAGSIIFYELSKRFRDSLDEGPTSPKP
jgi:TrmH family RNA methyltransferase